MFSLVLVAGSCDNRVKPKENKYNLKSNENLHCSQPDNMQMKAPNPARGDIVFGSEFTGTQQFPKMI